MPVGEQHGQADEHYARRDQSGCRREQADARDDERATDERESISPTKARLRATHSHAYSMDGVY